MAAAALRRWSSACGTLSLSYRNPYLTQPLKKEERKETAVITNKKVEILAPAGSFESMKAAVAAGADAVYMGGSRFGARAYADNPDQDKLLEAIDYVHLHGCSLYMTVNTLFKERELDQLYDYLLPYYRQGLDAVIVQDMGAFMEIRRRFPDLPIHASTQMTITGVYGAKALYELGAQRIVTARELSLKEIAEIHSQVPVEIESFVHGALCYCYSGQCLMSSLIGGRSGNRGRCAQPCRLPYEVKRDGKSFYQKESDGYVLNLKDLCTLDLIPDMVEAGVYSMKIEGRMKSPRYTAGVVSMYRKYVDQYLAHGKDGYRVDPKDKKLLLDLFDRGGFSDGYYQHHNGSHMVALKEKPAFRETNQELFDYLDKTYVQAEVKEPVTGFVLLEEGQPSCLSLSCDRGEETPVVIAVSGQIPESAKSQPITEEKVKKQIGKTGGTPFSISHLDVQVSGQVFLTVQALNELRRTGFEQLEEAILESYRRNETACEAKNSQPDEPKNGAEKQKTEKREGLPPFRLSFEDPEQLTAALSYPGLSRFADEIAIDSTGFPADSWQNAVVQVHQAGLSCMLILPHIFRTEAVRYFEKHLDTFRMAGFDGTVVRSMEEVQWLKEKGFQLPMVFDDTMYTWNHEAAAAMKAMGAARITMPLELNSRELQNLEADSIPDELVVYGYLPMMVSAQCIKKTTSGCDKKQEVLSLKDRTGKLLSVKNHCRFCYNTIYNPSPMSLLGCKKDVETLNADGLRMKFTIETGDETGKLLKMFLEGGLEEGEKTGSVKDFTRGHFRRGVE